MPEPTDRRAAERMPVSKTTQCNFVAPLGPDFGPSRIANVSTSGIGLIVLKKVEVGSLLSVSVANPPSNFARTFVVRVAHVTPQAGGTFLVGAQFEPPLTYEEFKGLVM